MVIVKIDLREYSVIDDHCHPFMKATEILDKEEFPGLVSFGDIPNAKSLLLYKQIIHELSSYLSSPPTPDGVVKARNAMSTDYPRYLERLFNDVRLKAMLVDDGYSEISAEHALPSIDIEEFKKFVPVNVFRVTRLEPLLKNSLDRSTLFEYLMDDINNSLEEAVKKRGAVAFKCVIAYRTGLDISKTDENEAKRDFKKYKEASATVRLHPHLGIKKLRDFMVYQAIKKSIDLDVPFMLHTGIGDADIVLKACNPINLFNLLKDEENRRAKIVLTHGGYPYAQEAAWLTNVFPNVYLDLSVFCPFTHANLPRRILDILEMAPVNKVIYGSDAFGIPELHWLSVKLIKKALSKALEEMISFGTINEDDAYGVAQLILSENAKKLFRLG